MNLFEQIVNAVLVNQKTTQQPDYYIIRPALEKEILHQDILRTLSKEGFLQNLTFFGGTCLRICYGFPRLSEDLDFTGGFNFKKNDLRDMGDLLKKAIWQKYNLELTVSEPVKETGNTHTWKIKIITSPERPDLPQQHINIDVCLLPSYERQSVMIKNHYGLEAGISGLIIMAESLSEIFADKIIALAMRPNRVKNRDIWDIYELMRRNINLSVDLLKQKIADRNIDFSYFLQCYNERLVSIKTDQQDFWREMSRFLTSSVFTDEITDKHWWDNLLSLLKDLPYSFGIRQ